MSIWISILAVVAMFVGVMMIPFGLPGLWFIVVVTLGLVLAGEVGWTLGLVVAGVAAVAELAEFGIVARFGRAYGGSRNAFWGAVIGGMLGLFVGFPVPVIGPVITAFIGTFIGAGAVTLLETRSVRRSARVGWGVVLARTVAVALKVGVSVAVIAAVGLALVL